MRKGISYVALALLAVVSLALLFGTYTIGIEARSPEAVNESNHKIAVLEAKIGELEAKVAEVEGSGDQATLTLSTADYDSGWRKISKGSSKKIRHKLGTKKLLVYIIGRYWEESGQYWEVHQLHYGGYWYYNYPNGMEYHFVGLWWWTDARNYIWVERGADDYINWEQFRVYIWRLS